MLSPRTSRYDRVMKFSRYAEAGMPQYWVVDPRKPSIEVFDLDADGNYQLTASAEGDEIGDGRRAAVRHRVTRRAGVELAEQPRQSP